MVRAALCRAEQIHAVGDDAVSVQVDETLGCPLVVHGVAQGAPYLRPIVLIQSEPRRAGLDTLDYERVRQELVATTISAAGMA